MAKQRTEPQPTAMSRFLDAVHYAGDTDVAGVLGALSGAELADAIGRARQPLAVAVSDHVLGRAPGDATPALAALAVRAVSLQTVADSGAVLRALLEHRDPALDEALFFPEIVAAPVWVRLAIVRDRRGPDGRPVIAPAIRRRLLAAIERTALRLKDHDSRYPARVEQDLLTPALAAADPQLALAALPVAVAGRYGSGALAAVMLLRSHGRQAELRTRWFLDPMRDQAQRPYSSAVWKLALQLIETDGTDLPDAAELDKARHDLYDGDRLPGDVSSWYSPGLVAERYSVPWEQVVARAEQLAGNSNPYPLAGLDEAAAREDLPADVGRRLRAAYPRAALLVQRPDAEALLAAQEEAADLNPALRHFALRQTLIRGLTRRSLSVDDALRHAAPAVELLALAVPTTEPQEAYYSEYRTPGYHPKPPTPRWWAPMPDDTALVLARQLKRPKYTAGSAVPGVAVDGLRGELRAALRARLAATVGTDPDRWAALLVRGGGWTGSVEGLLAAASAGAAAPNPATSGAVLPAAPPAQSAPADPAPVPAPAARAPRWPRGVDAGAVLLGLAPAGIAEALLAAETPALRGALARILDRGPIPAWLRDHALSPAAGPEQRRALARNPETRAGLLWRLVEAEPAEPEVLAAAYFHHRATEDMRGRIVVRSTAAGGLPRRLVARLVTSESDVALLRPALAAEDPQLVHTLLRKINADIDPGHRSAAYAALARQAGPEVVWALELERVGTLEKAGTAVRASMAAGDAGPLFEAADATPMPGYLADEIAGLPSFLAAAPIEDPAAGVAADLADLAWSTLGGRPDRWTALGALLRAEPELELVDAVRRLAPEAAAPEGAVLADHPPATLAVEDAAP